MFRVEVLPADVVASGWDGRLDAMWKDDYLMLVDANLNSWKSDYFVKRSYAYMIDLSKEMPEATLTIRREFRNNKQSAFGYGVFTGEPQALEFVEYGQIPLAAGQTIVLASDGVAPLFDSAPQMLYETSPEAILAEAEEFEAGQKMRSDDKAVIIVQIS